MLDFILVVSLAGFVWFGFWFGMIHMAGGLAGSIAGAYMAGHFYAVVAAPFEAMLGSTDGWVKVISFAVIFIAVNRFVGFVFYVLDRSFAFLTRIPFLKTIDRMAGAILGLAEGALVLGLTIFLSSRLVLPSGVESAIITSRVAQSLEIFAMVLVPLLPDALRTIQPYIPQVPLPTLE